MQTECKKRQIRRATKRNPLPDLMAVTKEKDRERTEDLHEAAKIYKEMIKESHPVNRIDVDKLRAFAEKYVRKERASNTKQLYTSPKIIECPSNSVPQKITRPPTRYDNQNKSLYGIDYNDL